MRRVSMLFAAAIVSLTACGGSDSPTGTTNGGTGGTYSASVGGAAWSSAAPAAVVTSSGVSVTGGDAGLVTIVTISFLATAPGTYSLSANQTGGLATVSKSNKGYSTVATGGVGSVTLTTLSAHHVVGTFSFDAIGSGPTDVLHVTNGKFDITL